MARTPSSMKPLGFPAPSFTLPNAIDGKDYSLDDLITDKGILIMFICNHCPFVKHLESKLSEIGKDYIERGLGVAAISSNDVVNYPEDSFEKMKEKAESAAYPFPYLLDETQQIARDYGAECTPDFFLFDAQRKLVYRGQLDDSRPDNGIPVTALDMNAAVDALLAGEKISSEQKPSIGCNIKWKS